MTTNGITCDTFNDRLAAYLEHETDDATRASIERHALSCAECGALLADLRSLRIDAANLPELAPSRDLWSGIAARIEAPVLPIGAPLHVQGGRSPMVRRWMRGAMLAASLVAAAGVGYLAAKGGRAIEMGVSPSVAQRGDTAPELRVAIVADSAPPAQSTEPSAPESRVPRAVATPVAQAAAPRPTEAQLAVATLTADYNREVVRLRQLIEQRRNQLDPVTVAVIEKNLQVIDTAIAECQKAILRDPASRFLIESLNQSLQTKVELMRTAAALPART
jgi:hypothetical protein